MNNIFLIGAGGALGSISRYLLGAWIQSASRSINFPYGTMAVNLIGCFVIGFLAQLVESRGLFSSESRAFVFIGILGGFTTFSTFGNETVNLARDGQMFGAVMNVGANVLLGLFAVWLGRTVSYLVWR